MKLSIGDLRQPWACIDWGGMDAGRIDELEYYTNVSDVPDWKIDSAKKGHYYSYNFNTTIRLFKHIH